jgi:hypothetical protein
LPSLRGEASASARKHARSVRLLRSGAVLECTRGGTDPPRRRLRRRCRQTRRTLVTMETMEKRTEQSDVVCGRGSMFCVVYFFLLWR